MSPGAPVSDVAGWPVVVAVVGDVCVDPVGPMLEEFSEGKPVVPAEAVAVLETMEGCPPVEEEVPEEEADPGFSANPVARQSHVWQVTFSSKLTDPAPIDIEHSVNVLEESISEKPLASDNIISKHVTGTNAIGHRGNPILGRNVVGSTREGEGQRSRSGARHCPGVVI